MLLGEVYELDDYKMPSDEVVKRLQAIIDEAFGRSGSWFTRYRLSPFLVGWNESYLQESKPSSKEFAEIYEQYVNEGGVEKIFSPRPGSQGAREGQGLALFSFKKPIESKGSRSFCERVEAPRSSPLAPVHLRWYYRF